MGVHVKVLQTWKHQAGETMEIILADENVRFIYMYTLFVIVLDFEVNFSQ